MPAPNPLLAPIVVLVLWTAVIWTWMYITRIPAIYAARMRLDPMAPRGQQMSELPARVRWKADNYNPLLEQPPLFYATALALVMMNDESQWSLWLAWAYVGLRIVHSLWQVLVNNIQVRFALFLVSSLVLFALAIRAALILF